MRLREELIKYTNDQSIFAWYPHNDRINVLLADSPLDFARTGSVVPYQGGSNLFSFSLMNKGINMSHLRDHVYGATLNCVDLSDESTGEFFSIYLRQIAKNDRVCTRCHAPWRDVGALPDLVKGRGNPRNVYISQDFQEPFQQLVVFLRRGPKSIGHHVFELTGIGGFDLMSSRHPGPDIPLLGNFIQRNKSISRTWIPDNLPYRLDHSSLSQETKMRNSQPPRSD